MPEYSYEVVMEQVELKISESDSLAEKLLWRVAFMQTGDFMTVNVLALSIGAGPGAVAARLHSPKFSRWELAKYIKLDTENGARGIRRI